MIMKLMKAILATICLSLAFSTVGLAQSNRTPGATKRQVNQRQRINQGVRSGEITRGEYRRIQNQQQDVRQEKREAKADGVVTRRERAGIHREQNQSSRQIYRTKHNRRDRN